MSITANALLAPAYVQELVSRLRLRNQVLQNMLGMGIPEVTGADSANVVNMGGRNFGWDIWDDIRDVADARMPGVGPEAVAQAPVGHVQGRYPRVHEFIHASHEEIGNRRAPGSPPNIIDEGGMRWIAGQSKRLIQRVVNHREFQVAALLRGSYTYTQSGDRLIPAFSGGGITINYQIPAGNLSKLDMLGAGDILAATWSNTGTDIPLHLYKIDDAMQQLTGLRLEHIVCTSTLWNHVQNNTAVKGLAGTANRVFEYVRKDGADPTSRDFTARLNGIPWIDWHICNEVLNINGTLTKLIPDTNAAFLPGIDGSWAQYWNGSEKVTIPGTLEDRGDQMGMYTYNHLVAEPSGFKFTTLMNGIPALFVPKAIAFGLCVY